LYAGKKGYPKQSTLDPRHFSNLLGTAETVEQLGGKWAPSATYGEDIVRLMQELIATPEPAWEDVSPWAREAWEWAVKHGITDGTRPKDAAYLKSDVGRRSISQAIACSTLEWLGVPAQHNEIAFADIVGHWAEAEIRKAYNLGLVKGRDDGLFHPGEPLTRAEAAIIACRLYDLLRR